MSEKKYIIDNANLIVEWDWEKNNDIGLDPSKLTCGSNKKAWWICNKNHSWETTISNRGLKKNDCPYCSGNKVLASFNDFLTLEPELSKYWDYSKNQILPSEVSRSAGKKVYWVCRDCGSSFLRRIADIKKPFCTTCGPFHREIPVESSLGELFPELLDEWDFSKNAVSPYTIKPHYNSKIYWNCHKCGSPFCCSPDYRISHDMGGCLSCKKNKLSALKKSPKKGVLFLERYRAVVHTYFDFSKNKDINLSSVSYQSNQKAHWLCKKCGTSWIAKFQDMAAGRKCPNCEAKKFKSFPEQCIYYYARLYFSSAIWGDTRYKTKGVAELDVFLPELKIAIEYDGEHWHTNSQKDLKKDKLCESLGITLIRIREPLCPKYDSSALKIIRQKNHQDDHYEDLNHTISTVLKLISDKQDYNIDIERDLPAIYVLNTQSLKSNSFGLIYPFFLNYWDFEKNSNTNPYQLSKTGKEKFYFLCQSCGESFKRSLSSLTRTNFCECLTCSRKRASKNRSYAPKHKSLGYLYPSIAKELLNANNDEIDIFSLYPGSPKKLWWECSQCGGLYEMSTNNRVKGHSCPKCGIKSRTLKRGIQVINLDKNETFNSISEASRYYHIDASSICACCKGKQKTAGGDHWAYKNRS